MAFHVLVEVDLYRVQWRHDKMHWYAKWQVVWHIIVQGQKCVMSSSMHWPTSVALPIFRCYVSCMAFMAGTTCRSLYDGWEECRKGSFLAIFGKRCASLPEIASGVSFFFPSTLCFSKSSGGKWSCMSHHLFSHTNEDFCLVLSHDERALCQHRTFAWNSVQPCQSSFLVDFACIEFRFVILSNCHIWQHSSKPWWLKQTSICWHLQTHDRHMFILCSCVIAADALDIHERQRAMSRPTGGQGHCSSKNTPVAIGRYGAGLAKSGACWGQD